MTECREVGPARFFFALRRTGNGRNEHKLDPQTENIERQIAAVDPTAELLAVEQAGSGGLRIYVDHPDGVTLELCERITQRLTELRQDYSVEVSSPGPNRPLVKPEHFERFEGRQARVKTSKPIDGQRKFTGTILDVSGTGITLGLDDRVQEIPHELIERSNLVPKRKEGAAK